MRPLVVAGFKADIVGVFAREAADEGHADIAIDVFGTRVKELAVPEDGIASLADEFTPFGEGPLRKYVAGNAALHRQQRVRLKYS